ncbi:MAG: hypothetical protein FIA97_16430 [Methylococcaceae bacterium]|nr:hypothetical protein [Methylococcaceae bacterium]
MKTALATPLRLVAVAAVLAGNSGSAWALLPSDGAPQLTLYIAGSQANDPNFVPALCIAGSSHVYFGNNGTISNNDYWAAYCNTDASKIPGLTGGTQRLWISRRRLGASFIGLDGVANDKALTHLTDPSACTVQSGTFTSGGVTFNYDAHCPYPTTTVVPTAATADTTPDVYKGENVPPASVGSFTPINPSVFTGGVRVLAGHIIGIPVTLQLRNALQFAQITGGSLTTDSLGSQCLVGSEDKTCQPSLTKGDLVSLFSGTINDWSTYYWVNAKPGNHYNVPVGQYNLFQLVTTHHGLAGADLHAPRDKFVHICRRENGAGQQVAMLANIFQSPCLGGNSTALGTNLTSPYIGYATSLGAVDSCLTDYNDGTNGWLGKTNTGYPNPPATDVAHGDQWALSIQTTERNATQGSPYRFIRIDGALPTGEEVYLGHYHLVGEYSLSWKNTVSANQAAALTALANYSQLPGTVLARNNARSLHPWGQAGYVALANNGFQADTSWSEGNPVSPWTHSASGTPNACAIPTLDVNNGNREIR